MIAIASDHGGFELKEQVREWLKELGADVDDFGCYDRSSVDYPDYAGKVAQAVADGRVERGVLICGTGIGMSIAANRVAGVRATLVHDAFTARMSRQHNDSNVLVLGGRVLGVEVAKDIVTLWYQTAYEGDRHQRRLDKIETLCRCK
jgi:ribose 5-phosphate isomerase B